MAVLEADDTQAALGLADPALARAHHEALQRLPIAAEFRDDDTGVHIVRMDFLAESLALALGQNAAWAKLLRMVAPMHAIGKIGVPDNVLKKPGPLTREERDVMNRHAQVGADILGASEVPLFKLTSEVALSHHERFDGGGYPRGPAAAAIPLSGRSVAAVDYFDALTMDRCHRDALPHAQAPEMMSSESGRLFYPLAANAFLERADDMVALSERISSHRPQFTALLDDEPLSALTP